MRGQTGKHIVHERGDLLVRRVKDFPDAVDERGNDQGQCMIERDVRKLVHDGVEQITEAVQKSPRLPHVHGEIAPPCRTTAPLGSILPCSWLYWSDFCNWLQKTICVINIRIYDFHRHFRCGE